MLARDLAAQYGAGAILADLERDSDLAALHHPERLLPRLRDRPGMFNEVQIEPGLFRAQAVAPDPTDLAELWRLWTRDGYPRLMSQEVV